MELSPRLYHWFIRPRFLTDLFINNIIKYDFDFNNKKILDFGSGTGSSSSIFAPTDYIGIDPDPKRIAYAKRLYPNYHFSVFQGSELPVSGNSIDYVLIIAVLHHIPSDKLPSYLQEFHRILKPQGKILVIEPCHYKNSHFNNWFMNFFDNGKYIRNEEGYLEIFRENHFQTKLLKRYKKLFYNEFFFSASPYQAKGKEKA